VYLLEYQVFTTSSVPIELWASTDDGQTWSVRYTFQGHRHGHTIRVAPDGGLWAFFGDSDSQAGIYRSTDNGNSWTEVLAGPTALGDDAVFLSNGVALYGQDISNLPDLPYVVNLTSSGQLTDITRLPGPAYSIQLTPVGGYLMGETWEPNDTVYAPGDTSAHLLGSADGVHWSVLGAYPTSNTTDYGRADVYWALKSGEVVLTLSNVTTLSSTAGYELLRVQVSGGGGGSDAGSGGTDAGNEDAGSSGAPDAGTSESFSDTFANCTATSGLGSSFETTGIWYCKGGFGRSESAGGIALALISLAPDQSVTARVELTGVASGSGVIARETPNHFDLLRIESAGTLEIDRVDNGVFTPLTALSTSIQSDVFYRLELSVSGAGPVQLTATLNGTHVATVTDHGAYLSAGAAGLYGGSAARTQYNDVTITSP
jgi:membrane-associated protease RseP (regulator of RpoE activity)